MRRMLEITATSWLALQQGYNSGLLLYWSGLVSFRCGIRQVRIGINSTMPNQEIRLPPCDEKDPMAYKGDELPYMKVPPTTTLVSVELTYKDGTVSEIKTFQPK